MSNTKPVNQSDAAKRALSEAKIRRQNATQDQKPVATEKGGRNGPEPTRFGDWEKNGITSDF